MNVDGSKIKALIDWYGNEKNYEPKSFVPRFVEDFGLNYNQWNAYTRGSQNMGTKVIQTLMEIFPSLNLNWLLKDGEKMFVDEIEVQIAAEPTQKYKSVTNEMIYEKLELMHADLVKK